MIGLEETKGLDVVVIVSASVVDSVEGVVRRGRTVVTVSHVDPSELRTYPGLQPQELLPGPSKMQICEHPPLLSAQLLIGKHDIPDDT